LKKQKITKYVKTANFILKYLFTYLINNNNNLRRRVSQQPHRHSSVGLVDSLNLMFKCSLGDIFYMGIQK
jgi:hypothetical protein